jgi:hypothetical protein
MTTLPQVSPTYQAALEYAMRGFAVIPVKGKRPLLKDWPNKASKNSEEINSWAIQYPDCNVGIVTGRISNIFVLDVDKLEALYEIETKYGNLPETLTCQTGGGGLHLYFNYPDDGIGNSTGELPNGLDIRGDGGQVVASPSRHESGNLYQWITKNEIADAPKWLLDLIRGKNSHSKNVFATRKPSTGLSLKEITETIYKLDPDLPYDKWIKVGMGIFHETNGSLEGLQAWGDWSSQGSKYKTGEPREKWSTFKANLDDRKAITFATVRKWASQARMVEDPLQEFLNRFVYVMDGDAVYDLEGLAHDKSAILKEFRNMFANIKMEIEVPDPLDRAPDRTKTKMVPVTSQWMVAPERKSARGFTYLPGGSEILEDAEGRQWINNFHMPVFANPCPMVVTHNGETKMDSEHVESLLKIFFQHMEYIIPVEEEREWFYSWMAFNLQRPSMRCKVTPLLIATAHGTGRGWIVQLMNLLLGSWNCSKTKMSTLSGESSAGQYQDFMNETLFCAVEEVKDADKPYGVLDSIRSYLTEDTLEINLKYGAKETKCVYTNFLWNSNHADALVLKTEDRRVNVFKTVDGPKGNDYYDRLYGWLEAEDKANEGINASEQTVDGEGEVYDRAGVKVSAGVACLFHWLRNRDLAAFNWKRSMHNKARQDLIENSQTNIEYYFLELVKKPPYEIMTLAEIKKELGMQKNDLSDDSCFLSQSEKKQIKKLAQQHLGKQERIKITREPEPKGDGWVTLDKSYEVHYWSLDKKKTFSTKEMRAMHDARKKW